MSGDHSCGVSAGKRALRGTGPALAGNVGTGGAFALVREGDYRVSTFLRSLRPGPAPLGVFGGALRGTGPALAGNVGTGGAFALVREGDYRVSTFLRSLRPGPAPLDVFGGALRGTEPSLAGNVGTGGAFALAREGNLRLLRFLGRRVRGIEYHGIHHQRLPYQNVPEVR